MLYAMLSYVMVWYNVWESMRLYAVVCDSSTIEWDSNAMLCNSNAMLWYGVFCKEYSWTDAKYFYL